MLALVAPLLLAVCSAQQSAPSPPAPRATAGGGPLFSIVPESEAVFRGPQGGPFEPARHEFVLRNDGDRELSWAVSATQPWVAFPGAAAGVVPARGEVSVECGVDRAAAAVSAGPQSAVGRFWISGPVSFITTRRVRLELAEPGRETPGWTSFAPGADTRTIYVSPSGDDAHDGRSPAQARRTLAAGIALLRDGYPDWLLLERGGTWHESLGHWVRSGRSESEPMLVGTYGTDPARPRLLTGTGNGIETHGGGGSPPRIDCLALVGLEFVADGYTGVGEQIGARLLQPSSHVLIEDCVFRGYAVNLVFQGFGGRHSDFTLRRSIIVDAWSTPDNGHSQGLYAYAVDGLLVEENVFDHNGWSETVPGGVPTMFNHNLYIDNGNTGVVVRGNIIANASSHGLQLRPGGVCVDNLFVRNSIAMQAGGGNHPDPGGVTIDVRRNVILDGKDIDADLPRGWGLWFANIASGQVAENVIANNVVGRQPLGIGLDGNAVGEDGVASIGVHDLLLERNIVYDWGGKLEVDAEPGKLSGITLRGNELQDLSHPGPLVTVTAGAVSALRSADNRFYSHRSPHDGWFVVGRERVPANRWPLLTGDSSSTFVATPYPDPGRGLASYSESLGGAGTTDDFLACARRQSRLSWQPSLTAAAANAYIRAGFGR